MTTDTRTKETLKLAPSPAEPNTRFAVNGAGYRVGERLVVQLEHSEMTYSPRRREVTADANGAFSLESTSHVAGLIEIVVYRPSATKMDRRKRPLLEVVAHATLVVEAASRN